MAIELVTGHSGAAHVSGADAGAMHAGICGSDSYVLGAVPSVTMSDANTLVIQPCDLMVEGRHVRLSGTNTLSIRSGAQTGKRNDLVYVRYTYDASTGTESAKLGVKEGTTATTATDPALDNPSSILDGATIADVAIARVSLDALTPTATWLLPQLPTLAHVPVRTLLYHNATRNQKQDVVLALPVTGFDEIEIFGFTDDNTQLYTRVYKPRVGTSFELDSVHYNDVAKVFHVKTKHLAIDGPKHINTVHTADNSAWDTGSWSQMNNKVTMKDYAWVELVYGVKYVEYPV